MAIITLLNYADHNFRSAQRKNSLTGSRIGGFDRVLSYGPSHIEAAFRSEHQDLLTKPRGGGYWLWKPYFIVRTLNRMTDGEWLFYCDSGSYFIQSVRPLIHHLAARGISVACFEDQHPEYRMTKRSVVEAIGGVEPEMLQSKQRLSGFIICRADPASRSLAGRWLELCICPGLVNDDLAVAPRGEHPEFFAHRHDQSVFSLLTKVERIEAFRDPSQFGNQVIEKYGNSPYGQLIQLTRQRNVALVKRIMHGLLRILKRLGMKG